MINKINDNTFSKTGCQSNKTTLKMWKEVYNKLKK